MLSLLLSHSKELAALGEPLALLLCRKGRCLASIRLCPRRPLSEVTMACEVIYALIVMGTATPLPNLTLHLSCDEAIEFAHPTPIREGVFIDATVHPDRR